jgi:hypothetical protein
VSLKQIVHAVKGDLGDACSFFLSFYRALIPSDYGCAPALLMKLPLICGYASSGSGHHPRVPQFPRLIIYFSIFQAIYTSAQNRRCLVASQLETFSPWESLSQTLPTAYAKPVARSPNTRNCSKSSRPLTMR